MTHAGGRGRWRRHLVALAVPGALGVLLAMPSVEAVAARQDASGSPSPAPATSSPAVAVAVDLQALTPAAPQPKDTLRLRGVLRNLSAQRLPDLQLQLRYQPAHIGSRGEFDAYACGTGCTPTSGGSPLPLPPVVVPATVTLARRTLAAGASEPFTVSAPMKAFDLRDPWQVYELGLQVNATATNGFGAVGGLRTFLPWAPVTTHGAGLPTKVAWIWPLLDRPHRSVGDTWLDDALAGELAENGRLATLLAAGQAAQDQQPVAGAGRRAGGAKARTQVPITPVPVTWAIDPMLVDDVKAMAAGYRIGTGARATTGRGSVQATAWLGALRAAVTKGETLALPYADPDVVAATRSGLGPQIQIAIRTGRTLLADQLSTTPLTYSWPPGAALDQRALDTLFATDSVSTVVLDDRALPVVGTAPNFTPTAHATVRSRDGNLDALLTDSTLDSAVDIGASDPAKRAIAVQRFLAETLMIQAESPFNQRTVVIAPDRRWSPAASYATALLTDTGRAPWIAPIRLSDALSTPVPTTLVRGPLHYTQQDRTAELSRPDLAAVRELSEHADTFAAILTPGDTLARTFDDAVLRTLSSAFRADPAAGDRYRNTVSGVLDATMARVRIASAPRSFVTLTSHSGTVPITVGNELNTPVHVVVAIKSQHLTVSGGGRAAQTIPPHRQIAVDVRASARTAGVFQLTVRLLTPNGQVYDDEQLFVRSTAYGTVAILITGGATGVLLIAVIIRLARRGLRARRADGAAA